MSPQVKVSYFGRQEAGALGHSVLYLTAVGKYCPHPRLPYIPSPLHVAPLRVLGEPLSARPMAIFLHQQGASSEAFHSF